MTENEKIPVLGYWDLRGYTGPVRHLLNYVGEEFEDKLYTIGPMPELKRDEWRLKDKTELDLDFTNLPYWIDGDIRITQVINYILILKYFNYLFF